MKTANPDFACENAVVAPCSALQPLSAPHAPAGSAYTEAGATSRYNTAPLDVPDPCAGPIPITLHALPSRPGNAPPAVRLRRLLKVALRSFGFRAAWGVQNGPESAEGERF